MPALNYVTRTLNAIRDVSSSEAASLHGQKAKTPIIAGSICGGLMGLAWIIGFTIYFIKRSKRKKAKRAVEAGLATPKKPKKPKEPEEQIIIPPDPAVLIGIRKPGEHAFPEREKSSELERLNPAHSRSDIAVVAQDQPLLRDEEREQAGDSDH
ncbi:uncharacterized protein BT62DRAFT_112161 [Guyanagaster necrorhizus]|uniref:Uncharacterized protein n=1 Tax=Guyanagaster necrorhizus TaxID=856835 RepID=A0A9P7VT32_9AGAR|nr:uncharacterized protein BT62DRAFT_112161 [Guyanagaster necrorhizus MCA 3950]KAG7446327.1 hypothetical protein BT62DRAFT_112161 [Guyanagaster necrorhizus MCA 3950]